MKQLKRWNKYVALFFIGSAIAAYYVVLSQFAVNMPYGDEIATSLIWMNRFVSSNSLYKQFVMLFSQANEHRLLTNNLATLFDHSMFGELNFVRFLWYGNLFMLLLLFQFYSFTKNLPNKEWYLLVVALLLFAPQQDVMNWGVVTYASVVFYTLVVGSLLLLDKGGVLNLSWAILLAAAAAFSFGNGLLVFFAGYSIILFNPDRSKTRIIFWTLGMLITFGLFFTAYDFRDIDQKTNIIQSLWPVTLYFFGFLGGGMQVFFTGNMQYLPLNGILLTAFVFYILIFHWKKAKQERVLLAGLLFIYLTAAMVAVSRHQAGIVGAISPRYGLIHALFLLLIFLLVARIFVLKSRMLAIVVLFSLVLYGLRFANTLPMLRVHQDYLLRFAYASNTDFTTVESYVFPPQFVHQTLLESEKKHVFFVPEVSPQGSQPPKINFILPSTKPSDRVNHSIDALTVTEDAIFLKGWVFTPDRPSEVLHTAVVFRSNEDSILFQTIQVLRKDVAQYFGKQAMKVSDSTGFQLVVSRTKFPLKGTYSIGFALAPADTISHYLLTHKKVNLDEKPGNKSIQTHETK